MIKYKNILYQFGLLLKGSSLGVFTLSLIGCTGFSLYSSPQVNWQAAPGFSSYPLTKIAIISEDLSMASSQPSRDSKQTAMRAVEDAFIEKLLPKGYKISTRSDVERVLNEIRFQQSGLTEEGAAKLGRMLNVPAVLIVTVNSMNVTLHERFYRSNTRTYTYYRGHCNISARLISVEKAEILGISSFSGETVVDNPNDITPTMIYIARVVAASIPNRENRELIDVEAEMSKPKAWTGGNPFSISTLTGHWEGTVSQPNFRSYGAVVTLTDCKPEMVCGSVSYPSIPCNGTLTFLNEQQGKYRFRAKVTSGKCTDDNTLLLEPVGEGDSLWGFYYDKNQEVAKSVLKRKN